MDAKIESEKNGKHITNAILSEYRDIGQRASCEYWVQHPIIFNKTEREKKVKKYFYTCYIKCITFDPISGKTGKEVRHISQKLFHTTVNNTTRSYFSRLCRLYSCEYMYVCARVCFERWLNKIYTRRVPSIFAIVENITDANAPYKISSIYNQLIKIMRIDWRKMRI